MIPADFVLVDQLPRNAAGKIDRHALARLDADSLPHGNERTLVAPRTNAEHTIAAIWREVLKVEDVGIDDDFFELGGDSLLSIRVISRAGREGLRVSPERFFERPTIRQMAAMAAESEDAKLRRDHPATKGEAPLAGFGVTGLDDATLGAIATSLKGGKSS
jgi:hypothetical protein